MTRPIMMTPEVRTAIGLMCRAKNYGPENMDLFQNCGCPDNKAISNLDNPSIVYGWKCAVCDKELDMTGWVRYVRGTHSGEIVPIEGYCNAHFTFPSHYLHGFDFLAPEMKEDRERWEKTQAEIHNKVYGDSSRPIPAPTPKTDNGD